MLRGQTGYDPRRVFQGRHGTRGTPLFRSSLMVMCADNDPSQRRTSPLSLLWESGDLIGVGQSRLPSYRGSSLQGDSGYFISSGSAIESVRNTSFASSCITGTSSTNAKGDGEFAAADFLNRNAIAG